MNSIRRFFLMHSIIGSMIIAAFVFIPIKLAGWFIWDFFFLGFIPLSTVIAFLLALFICKYIYDRI